MDIFDQASEREQHDRMLAIAAASHSAPDLPAINKYYNYHYSIPVGMRFCDADCARDFEYRRNAEIRRGAQ